MNFIYDFDYIPFLPYSPQPFHLYAICYTHTYHELAASRRIVAKTYFNNFHWPLLPYLPLLLPSLLRVSFVASTASLIYLFKPKFLPPSALV